VAGESLIQEAMKILEPTDHVLLKYGALLDLAEIQRQAGGDPRAALEAAFELADEKASPVMAAAAAELLAAAVVV
jgi:hypothetical protein